MRGLDCCFFFSSRRRHTRWTGDWSSDVCSSDLAVEAEAGAKLLGDEVADQQGLAGIAGGEDDGARKVAVTQQIGSDGGPRYPDCGRQDRKSTRLNSSHPSISYAVFCLKKKKKKK